MGTPAQLSPAARAFDTIAPVFDQRFDPWLSVASQRRAVRTALAEAFPPGARVIDIGGGTAEDARWLSERGRDVLLTDVSPAMVAAAAEKLRPCGSQTEVAAAEDLSGLVTKYGARSFDGAYSNFAGLNCVADLRAFASGLAQLLKPDAPALLVVFGTCSPGEMLVEALRGRPRNMFRRFATGDVPAKLGGETFSVRYHRERDLRGALSPWFKLEARKAIGLFVPPSAAEPFISAWPRLLGAAEWLDKRLARPLAYFGDHILYRFVRTSIGAPQA